MSVAVNERFPLSLQQEFLCIFDKGEDEGPFGPRYHHVGGWRIRGKVDKAILQDALDDVVRRHESLRTVIVRDDGPPYLKIADPSPVRLEVRPLVFVPEELRNATAEAFLNEIEGTEFDTHKLPLVEAYLGRFGPDDAVLALKAHHTAVDSWSVQLMVRDLAHLYAARAGHPVPELEKPLQYREYAAMQRAETVRARSRAYWREKLAGGEIIAIPTQRMRSTAPAFRTSWYRFTMPGDLAGMATAKASELRSSAFMVFLAAFKVMIRDMTGQTDLVVPTFTPGRSGNRIQDTVGAFFNFLPLRTDISDCADFRDVVLKCRTTCLEAYKHELPLIQLLEEAPDLMRPAAIDGLAACVFQVVQSPFTMTSDTVGGLTYTAISRHLLSQPVGSDIPDGSLWSLQLDGDGRMNGSIGYSSNLYDEAPMVAMLDEYEQTLRRCLA